MITYASSKDIPYVVKLFCLKQISPNQYFTTLQISNIALKGKKLKIKRENICVIVSVSFYVCVFAIFQLVNQIEIAKFPLHPKILGNNKSGTGHSILRNKNEASISSKAFCSTTNRQTDKIFTEQMLIMRGICTKKSGAISQ